MANPDLKSTLATCTFYPVRVDLCRRVIWFAEVERETYRQAGFLSPRQARMGEARYGFNLDDVLLHDLGLAIGGGSSHYIFISAFCCSTLLARLLDEVPNSLVLREPTILGQLAMMRYGPGTPEANAERERDWQTWAGLGQRLLTRTFEPSQTVIVKAADVCNTMGDVILEHDSRSKGVLLSVGLRTFILSVLKLEDRKKWTRRRAAFWHKTLTLFPALNGVNVAELDDAKKAAYIWLVTGTLWDRFRKQADSERLLLMDGEEVSENPARALRDVTGFFGLPLEESRLQEVLTNPVLNHHAKFTGRAYDAATRRSDRAIWEVRFGAEADSAMEWAAAIQEELEADGVKLSAMAGVEGTEVVSCST